MKKILILTALFFAFYAPAKAEIIPSSATTNTVALSSSAAVLVDTASILMGGRQIAELNNKGTNNIYCGFSAAETTVANGRKILPGQSWWLTFSASKGSTYCIAETTAGSVSITQAYDRGGKQ